MTLRCSSMKRHVSSSLTTWGESWGRAAQSKPSRERGGPSLLQRRRRWSLRSQRALLLGVEELAEELGVRGLRGLGLREEVREAAGRGGEVEPLQERAHLGEGILRLGLTRHDRVLRWGAWSPACSRGASPESMSSRAPRASGRGDSAPRAGSGTTVGCARCRMRSTARALKLR